MNEKLHHAKKTQVVLLGTGTPNADPDRSGPAVAIVVGDNSYLVDFGPGIVRRAAQAYRDGIVELKPKNLKRAFLTHLHSDHSVGYPDLIFTPWVLDRDEPLKVFGPKGLRSMTDHILAAYQQDIDERLNGLEPANNRGCEVEVNEITPGIIYQDENVKVKAFPVKHGSFEAYGYKFYTSDKTIVISGDTAPTETIIDYARDCDILIHEVYSSAGVKERSKEWKKYHTNVHTSSYELGEIASKAKPKLLVLYHQLFMLDIHSDDIDLVSKVAQREYEIVEEVKEIFDGEVISGKDLDVY
ncbi:MBL fold metallo-hydrolase [Vallitalea okinawensis]|uniref:MBL fold metallo-hydrolase n=1 Tax=Vallitalea okinawensis TaxID=2078660 RepID=UPI000CFDAA44|nr:MBL fold metallo-hydrolase [Vallitalea okinawensis]